jgi:hypothetical protein
MPFNDIEMIHDVHSEQKRELVGRAPTPRQRVWSEVASRTRLAIGLPVARQLTSKPRVKLAARWPSTH